MKVTIDIDRCEGHGRCYMLAPEIFEPDEIGLGRTKTEHIEGDLVERAQQAVRNCPENAISVTSD